MTLTAVWPIQVAADLKLQVIHPGQVHQEGEVTKNDVLPYDVFGGATEPADSQRYFKQPGLDQTLFITFWATTKLLAHQRFAEGKAALDGTVLTLAGYGKTVKCVLGFVRDIADRPEDGNARGVVAQLATQTLES